MGMVSCRPNYFPWGQNKDRTFQDWDDTLRLSFSGAQLTPWQHFNLPRICTTADGRSPYSSHVCTITKGISCVFPTLTDWKGDFSAFIHCHSFIFVYREKFIGKVIFHQFLCTTAFSRKIFELTLETTVMHQCWTSWPPLLLLLKEIEYVLIMCLGKNEAGHTYTGLHIISRYSKIHVQNTSPVVLLWRGVWFPSLTCLQ